MSELVVSDPGERYLLDRAIRTPWVSTEKWVLRLFGNDFVPCKDMVLSDFTEATYLGYAAVDLPRSGWSDPVTVAGVAQSFHGTIPIAFGNAGATVNIYGYYVTVPDAAGLLLLAERFDSPFVFIPGIPLEILPQLTLHSENEPDC